MRGGTDESGWAYFVSFNQAAKDFAQLARTPLTMPVLAIGGEKSMGAVLGVQMKSVARDVTVIVLKNTGHWILEENTRETTDALTMFL
jgi:pimeloyl-ACP methyl ester carboxylesterase